jgi:hypothetical protein
VTTDSTYISLLAETHSGSPGPVLHANDTETRGVAVGDNIFFGADHAWCVVAENVRGAVAQEVWRRSPPVGRENDGRVALTRCAP